MAILIDEAKRVLVQGITGREGTARTRLMLDFGTNVVAGCTPGKGGSQVLGMIGGRAESAREWFRPGRTGVASRSGGMTSAIGYYLSRAGIGLSTLVHVSGDPVVGTPLPDVMELIQADDLTDSVVMFGETGGTHAEKVRRLGEVGVTVVDSFGQLPEAARRVIGNGR